MFGRGVPANAHSLLVVVLRRVTQPTSSGSPQQRYNIVGVTGELSPCFFHARCSKVIVLTPVFRLKRNQKMLPRRITMGKYDGEHPCLTVAINGQKVRSV